MPDCPKVVGIFIISRIVRFYPVNLILQIKLQTGKMQFCGINLFWLA